MPKLASQGRAHWATSASGIAHEIAH